MNSSKNTRYSHIIDDKNTMCRRTEREYTARIPFIVSLLDNFEIKKTPMNARITITSLGYVFEIKQYEKNNHVSQLR